MNGSRYVGSFLLLNETWPDTPYFGHPTGENMLDGGAPYYGTYRSVDSTVTVMGSVLGIQLIGPELTTL